MGDFNLRNINWSTWTTPHNEESKEAQFAETIRDCYLYVSLLEPACSRSTDSPSLMGLMLTTEVKQVSNIEYHSQLGKSNRYIITLNMTATWITPNKDMSTLKLTLMR